MAQWTPINNGHIRLLMPGTGYASLRDPRGGAPAFAKPGIAVEFFTHTHETGVDWLDAFSDFVDRDLRAVSGVLKPHGHVPNQSTLSSGTMRKLLFWGPDEDAVVDIGVIYVAREAEELWCFHRIKVLFQRGNSTYQEPLGVFGMIEKSITFI